MTNTIEQASSEINQFLKSNKTDVEIRFVQGYFIKLKKHIKKGLPFLEIHTSGYDDTLTVTEAIEWLKWELIDRRANGFMI
jgi:hypothetical protein